MDELESLRRQRDELLQACELALDLSEHCLKRLNEPAGEAYNIEVKPEWYKANEVIASAIATVRELSGRREAGRP